MNSGDFHELREIQDIVDKYMDLEKQKSNFDIEKTREALHNAKQIAQIEITALEVANNETFVTQQNEKKIPPAELLRKLSQYQRGLMLYAAKKGISETILKIIAIKGEENEFI